jgi:folate-binding protein YgfZ
LFTCIRQADDYLLDMDPVVTEFTAAFLEKYTIIRDAKTENLSADFAHFGLYGPKAAEVAAAGLGVDAAALPLAVGQVVILNEVFVLATEEYGVAGFELLLPVNAAEATWQALVAAGAEHQVAPFGFEALESLRMEMGRARYGVEVDDDVILLEAGFADVARFDKGCYIGQETLSRINFRGHVNKGLRGLALDELPKPGAEVIGGDKVVGEVKSAVFSPTLGRVLALAYVKRSHWEPGAEVTVDGVPAQVVALPLSAG